MGDNNKKRDAELVLIAAVAAQCKTAVITGPAAARWLGLSTLNWVKQVDLLLPGNSRTWGTQYHDRIYHGGVFRDAELCIVNGVRTAIGVRTMFDTYRYYGRLEALVQIESARWKHSHLTTDVLLKKAEVLPKARGIKGFRALIEWSADSSASALETIVRDRILGAVEFGRLQGVEKIEFQVGFQIMDEFGSPTTAWVDCIINDCIIVESDGAEKTSGAMGNAVAAVNSERHREKQLQNKGGVFFRVGWDSALAPGLIDQLQHVIDLHPGVRPMRGRLPVAYREWSKDMEWRFS